MGNQQIISYIQHRMLFDLDLYSSFHLVHLHFSTYGTYAGAIRTFLDYDVRT